MRMKENGRRKEEGGRRKRKGEKGSRLKVDGRGNKD